MTQTHADKTLRLQGWRDDPIKSVAQDRFNRVEFSRAAAQLICRNHSSDSSVVYGLEGKWGSGKSSAIALLISHLSEVSDGTWKTLQFTPWATTGTDGLLSEFFATLLTAAPRSGSKTLKDLIVKNADIARSAATLIPVAGTAVSGGLEALEKRLDKPWSKAFGDLAGELRKLETPILIVVDDIDRLQPPELYDLLRVVRLLGRFPNVDFLLAYDEQSIIETLSIGGTHALSKHRARSFMEKIVQYPLSLPPLLLGQIVELISDGLSEIATPQFSQFSYDKERFSEVVYQTMPTQLTTPRAIERYLAQVREQFAAHETGEVNDVDLILATFLKVQFPDVFVKLQYHKAALTRSAPLYGAIPRGDHTTEDWEKLVETVDPKEDGVHALAVLRAIFPAVHGGDYRRTSPGCFAHADYFDRYIAQAIPVGDIPDALIAHALDDAASGDDGELRRILCDESDARVTLALSKILDRYPDLQNPTHPSVLNAPANLKILGVAMDLVNAARPKVESWTSHADQLRIWAAALLLKILMADQSVDANSVLEKCTSVHRRVEVLVTLRGSLINVEHPVEEAVLRLISRESERVFTFLSEELQKQDLADAESGSGFLFDFVRESPFADALERSIAEGLASNLFTIEDVAARFVGFSYLHGSTNSLKKAYFSGESFSRLTGVEARSSDAGVEVEWSRDNWVERRNFARSFLAA